MPAGPAGLATWAEPPHRTGLVLVRRGGYAVGVAAGERLTASKVGTRYVQSRTAAGGWSQQRYARRRVNQADELVAAVAGTPCGWSYRRPRSTSCSVATGPWSARSSPTRGWPRWRPCPARELYDLPDPRLSVLEQALRRARAVRVTLQRGVIRTALPVRRAVSRTAWPPW